MTHEYLEEEISGYVLALGTMEKEYDEKGNVTVERIRSATGDVYEKRMGWRDNGIKRTEEEFLNGIPHGKRLKFWRNGNIEHEDTFTDGKRQHRGKTYYEDGRVSIDRAYKDDKAHGESYGYDWHTGEMTSIVIFRNGERTATKRYSAKKKVWVEDNEE